MNSQTKPEKPLTSTPFSINQKLLQHSVIESITKINYHEDVTNEQMFAFPNSYLVFDYGGCTIFDTKGKKTESPKIYIKSARYHTFTYNKNKNTSYIIFRLKPSTYFKITGLDASVHNFKYTTLDNYLSPTLINELYYTIYKLDDTLEIYDYFSQKLSNYIVKLNQKTTPVDTVVSDIVTNYQEISLEAILTKYPYSISTLNRYFKKYIGMTVGLYIRLVKFDKLIRGLYTGSDQLQDIIAQYNFYDQTHLTKDFRIFSGITPAQYRGPNHKILHKAMK